MSTPVIEVKDVFTRFGDQVVHDGIHLTVLEGKINVLVGPSGAGKSQMLKYILGLSRPNSGEVLIRGENILNVTYRRLQEIRMNFGVVFQGAALLDSLTVYENVALPLREKTRMSQAEIEKSVMEKLEAVGLRGAEYKFPVELSGGMRRRVGLARALQRDPDTLLFDEPTTGLDPEIKQNIYALLKNTQEQFGFTALIISHDIPKIFGIVDSISVLYGGKIAENLVPGSVETHEHPWLKKILDNRIPQESPVTDFKEQENV